MIRVTGRERCALLDTGCQQSRIARKFVPDVGLEPPDKQMRAANGTSKSTQGVHAEFPGW